MKMYTKRARSVGEYARMRGVTDFTNAAQFNLYEKGYSHLFVISRPEYLEKIAETDPEVSNMLRVFTYILEYEFKGLDGIEDISVDSLEVTDGISTMNVVGKVNKQSASEVSMTFTEKSGSVITNFLKYYLEGIKDPRTQAKTYHGLIKYGLMSGGFEKEVFNLLYVVTDNTMLSIEKSYLLCNAWPTKAQTSIYNSERGSIEKADIEVSWQCFVVDGPEVDARALDVLAFVNEKEAVSKVYDKQIDEARIDGITKHTITKNQIATNEIVHLEYDGGQSIGGITPDGGFMYHAVSNDTEDSAHLGNYTERRNGDVVSPEPIP